MFDVTQIPSISLANEGNRRDPKECGIKGEYILRSTNAFSSGRIVRQARVKFLLSPEGSLGFESAPLHQPVSRETPRDAASGARRGQIATRSYARDCER